MRISVPNQQHATRRGTGAKTEFLLNLGGIRPDEDPRGSYLYMAFRF
jgi:hypothetical protein